TGARPCRPKGLPVSSRVAQRRPVRIRSSAISPVVHGETIASIRPIHWMDSMDLYEGGNDLAALVRNGACGVEIALVPCPTHRHCLEWFADFYRFGSTRCSIDDNVARVNLLVVVGVEYYCLSEVPTPEIVGSIGRVVVGCHRSINVPDSRVILECGSEKACRYKGRGI